MQTTAIRDGGTSSSVPDREVHQIGDGVMHVRVPAVHQRVQHYIAQLHRLQPSCSTKQSQYVNSVPVTSATVECRQLCSRVCR
jgi:hypothetical protein